MKEVRGAADVGPINPEMLVDPEPHLAGLTVVSVDDHVVEPPDLFEGSDAERSRGPYPFVVELKNGAHAWYIDGRWRPPSDSAPLLVVLASNGTGIRPGLRRCGLVVGASTTGSRT